MKRCGPFTCWTDYPVTELGDIPGKLAPIRRVLVLGYDGDKYARVHVLEEDLLVFLEIKWGYLYSKPVRWGSKHVVNRRKLERML